jgi:hypothetical protein
MSTLSLSLASEPTAVGYWTSVLYYSLIVRLITSKRCSPADNLKYTSRGLEERGWVLSYPDPGLLFHLVPRFFLLCLRGACMAKARATSEYM